MTLGVSKIIRSMLLLRIDCLAAGFGGLRHPATIYLFSVLMRKFIRNILLFGLPFLGVLTWLLASEPEKAYSYNMIQKDCRTGGWMYRRLYESDAPVDVAFVGTSKTMCDVNDSLLQHRVKTELGPDTH